AFESTCSDGVPVLYPLSLIDDDQFRPPCGDHVEIGSKPFIIRDLAEILHAKVILSPGTAATDDPRCILALAPGKARNLALPLVFEGGWANHQDARDPEVPRQYFHRGDGLDGFAQAHIVADQCAAGAHREECALRLIKIERYF